MSNRLKERMTALLEDARISRERKRLAYEFGGLLEAVAAVAARADAPEGTRAKAAAFIAVLEDKEVEHEAAFFQEVFLLNIVGEAMARTSYLAQPVIDFLRGALYFHGVSWVERNQRGNSLAYLGAHAELVMEMTSRRGLKALLAVAAERFAADRPFCLSNHYLAELKKRYWAGRRESEDACDRSVSLEAENGSLEAASRLTVDRDAQPATGEDRVQVMLRVFARDLGEIGQRVYLLRHPIGRQEMASVHPDLAAELAAMLDGDETGGGRNNWTQISDRLGISEKVAKKEYLRALHDLLAGAAREIYGDRLPSSFVRRVLGTLRSILQERDLRIKENVGRGMTRLVERWEIALRFVLNNERLATAGRGEGEFFQASAGS
ncbi:MAG: hypothetical protein H6807_14250 [Planctomycetes bacterium]|nr:hypothetical protein [Planctomycetota bacterium]